MKVQILGTGCPKCNQLEQRVRNVIEDNQLNATVEKITEINDIMDYGITMTPGLAIDGTVKSSGKLPSESDILSWLSKS